MPPVRTSLSYGDLFEFLEDYRTNLKQLTSTVPVPRPVRVGDDVAVAVRVPVFETDVVVQGRVMAPMGNQAGLQLDSADAGLKQLEEHYAFLGRLVKELLVSGRFQVTGQWADGAAPVAAAGAAPRRAAGLVDPATLGAPSKEGSLDRDSMTALLMDLHSRQTTGVIEMRIGTQRRLAYLKGGGIVQYVNDPVVERECLGVLLARAGRLTPEQLEESLEKMNQTGEQQGQVLIQMGLLSFPQLVMSLMTQVEIVTRGILGADEGGTWRFWELSELPSTVVTPPMKTAAFLFDFHKKRYKSLPREVLQNQLEPLLDQFCKLGPNVNWEDMRLKKAEARLVEILAERSYRFREVFSVSNLNRGATEEVLLALQDLGLLEIEAEEDTTQVHDRWLAELEKKALFMRDQNPFERLEAHWTSRTKHIEAAYQRMKAEYEGFGRGKKLPPRVDELRKEILGHIEEAYRALATTAARQETRKQHYEAMQHEFSADLLFKQGEMLMVRERWADALDNFERAIELNPREPKFRKFRDMVAGRAGGA